MYGIIALSQGKYSGRLLFSVQDCVRCYSLSVYVNSGTQEVIVTYGVPKCQIEWHQKVLNAASRVTQQVPRYSHQSWRVFIGFQLISE